MRVFDRGKLLMRSPVELVRQVGLLRQAFQNEAMRNSEKNPLTRASEKNWSQSNEDGIIAQIMLRLKGSLSSGTFLEFGVGDGRENNSLALLARGWKGAWVGGEALCFEPHQNGRLVFEEAWVDLENLDAISKRVLDRLGNPDLDIVSMDFDGNDFHFVKALLGQNMLPPLWVVEYNARFPVGAEWVMPYSPDHRWAADDYFGASISSYCEMFMEHDYFLVACSAQGANAFFVRGDFRDSFTDIQDRLEDLYEPLFNWEYKASPRTLASLTAPYFG